LRREEMDISKHGGDVFSAAEEYGLNLRDILDFSANINPLGPPLTAIRAIKDNLDLIVHYPDPDCRELKAAISDYLGIDRDNILVGNGSSALIYQLVRTIKPQLALIPSPTFSEYELAIVKNEGRVRFAVLEEERNFALDIEDLIRRSDDIDIIFLCNPNNPTGSINTSAELEELINFAEDRGIWVVIDEAFMDFVENRDRYSLITRSIKYDNLIVLGSLTKIFALAGLRLGYAVARWDNIERLAKYTEPWSVNYLAQVAGASALKDKEYIMRTKDLIRRERKRLWNELSTLRGIKPFPSVANYILVRILEAGLTADMLGKLLARKGILIRDCSSFRSLDERYIRLAVKDREANSKLLKELKYALSDPIAIKRGEV